MDTGHEIYHVLGLYFYVVELLNAIRFDKLISFFCVIEIGASEIGSMI